MSRLFDADSPLLRFLTRIADLMILNLVFVVTSVPVLTLGAALTALHHTATTIGRGECESVTGDYLRSFRANVRQATLLGLAVAALGAVLAAWYLAVEVVDLPVVLQFVLQAICYLVAFRFVLAAPYVFAYQATFEDSVRDVLRNARLMSLRHLFASLTILTVTVLPVVITVFYPAVTAYGLFWFLFGFAGTAFVNGFVFRAVFGTYIAPRAAAATSGADADAEAVAEAGSRTSATAAAA